jgi:flavin-dependent dehydrogenase
MKYDVIVVGGGPAGLTAAKTAAENGLKVLLLERKKEITKINRVCGQFANISLRNVGGVQKYGYTGPLNLEVGTGKTRINFSDIGLTLDYTGPIRPYLNYIFFSPSGHKVYREKDRFFGFYWEKEALLSGLLSAAEAAETKIISGTIVLGAENTPDGIRVYVRNDSIKTSFEAKRVIATDGLTSTIAESLGMNKYRKVILSADKSGDYYFEMEGISCDYRLNSWIIFNIPSTGRANLFMLTGDRNGIGKNMDKIKLLPAFENWFRNARVVRKTAAAPIFRSPLWECAVNNVVIAGDAAVSTEASNPGAIAGGFMAAKATLKELRGEKGYQEYIKWFRTAYDCNYPDYFKAAGRNFALNAMLDDEEVDYLFQVIQDQIGVPAILVANNMRHIKTDNPKLYHKLDEIGMSEDPNELKIDLVDTLGKF